MGSRVFYASKGVFAYQNTSKISKIGNKQKIVDVLLWAHIARIHIKNTIDSYLPGDEGALIKGILIGDKQDFSVDLKEAFRLSGLSHIVAVSGLHICIFIVFISFSTSFFTFGKTKAVFILLFILSYIALANFQPSVQRAAIMAIFGLIMSNVKLRKDSFCAIMTSTALLAIINPYLMLNVGFLLSFSATLGIILLGGMTKFNLAGAGIAASIFTAPIIAYCFNTITFAALFTSILISPLVVMAFLLGLIMSVVPYSGVLLSPILFCISHVMILISKLFASFKFLTIDVASPQPVILICSYICIYLIYIVLIKRNEKAKLKLTALILSLLLIYWGVFGIISANNAEITFIGGKIVDSIYIESPNCYNIIIGKDKWRDIYYFLHKKNIKKLDAVILTGKTDMAMLNFLADKIEICSLYVPNYTVFDASNCNIYIYQNSESFVIDNIQFDGNYIGTEKANINFTCYNTSVITSETAGFDKLSTKETIFVAADNQKDTQTASFAVTGSITKPIFTVAEKNTQLLTTYNHGSITFKINQDGITNIKKTRISR